MHTREYDSCQLFNIAHLKEIYICLRNYKSERLARDLLFL